MIPELGHFSLILAMLVAAAQTYPLLTRNAVFIQSGLCLFALAAMAWSYISSDFTVIDVVEHSHTEIPLAGKLAAMFAHVKGAALLAVTLLSFAAVSLLLKRPHLTALRLMGLMAALFIAYILFALHPFARIDPAPYDGMGLEKAAAQTVRIGDEIPAFAAGQLTAQNIKGPAVINFFASWCIPCEAEHDAITALSETVPVYGINFKDSVEDMTAYLQRLGNPYTIIGADPSGSVAKIFGVQGVPSTFVIDADNIIRYRHDAPLTQNELTEIGGIIK